MRAAKQPGGAKGPIAPRTAGRAPKRGAAQSEPGAPTRLPLRRVTPDQPAAELVRSAFEVAVARIRAADPEARRGDVEGVHHLRTATRRLRSELRTLRPLVKAAWRKGFEADLKWLADMLAGVRDLDVLDHRFREGHPDHGPSAPGPFLKSLRERHRDQSRQLREALGSDRYRELIARLEVSQEAPEVTARAEKPCRKVLPSLADDAWKRLRKHARKLDRKSPDEAFHEVRKLAKRARYSAELIAPALGEEARDAAERFIRLATQIQDLLGEHQDATVAAADLERFQAEGPPGGSAGSDEVHDLIRAQRRAADQARAGFFEVWPRLDRKKSLRWLRHRG